jgi:hypothetical protein
MSGSSQYFQCRVRLPHPRKKRGEEGKLTINVDEGNADPSCRLVANETVTVATDDASNDDQGHEGAKCTTHEERTAANLVDQGECWQG